MFNGVQHLHFLDFIGIYMKRYGYILLVKPFLTTFDLNIYEHIHISYDTWYMIYTEWCYANGLKPKLPQAKSDKLMVAPSD